MWHLGETRYVYSVVSSATSTPFTISGATYKVYDTADPETVLASGMASIDVATMYALWTPSAESLYLFEFTYNIGSEILTSTQVIEVKEIM